MKLREAYVRRAVSSQSRSGRAAGRRLALEQPMVLTREEEIVFAALRIRGSEMQYREWKRKRNAASIRDEVRASSATRSAHSTPKV